MAIKDVLPGIEIGQPAYFIDIEADSDEPVIASGHVRKFGCFDGNRDVLTVSFLRGPGDEEYRRIHCLHLFTEGQMEEMLEEIPDHPVAPVAELISESATRNALVSAMRESTMWRIGPDM